MQNREEILKRFDDDLWQSSDHTRASRLAYARKFLDFTDRSPEEWDRSLVIRFMKKLDKEGYSKGTQRLFYTITKRVFDAAGAPWLMGKRGAPRVQPSDVLKPTLELEQVNTMVNAAKEGKLAPDETAFLALSTTLALRREELIRVEKQHIDYEKGQIYVMTCKGGIERYQLLAPEIIPYLRGHDFTRPYFLSTMSNLYRSIEIKAGIEHQNSAGWHSLRRALDTVLVQWNYIYCKIFLRWKLTGDMALAYVTLDPLKIDEKVYENHPFLPFWR